jgi:hypothetical protein
VVTPSTSAGRRTLLDFVADELKRGLTSASGLEPATRSELLGLVDDLVELAGYRDDDFPLAPLTPFDPVYLAVDR